MSTEVKISELPAASANANAVVPATNAAGTVTQKVTLGDIAALGGGPPAAHTHGNVTNDGKIGTTDNLPIKTGSGGVLEAGAFGSSAGQFCEGNDARLSDSRTPTAHKSTHATGGGDALTAADIGAAASSHTHAWGDITSGVPSTFAPSAHTHAGEDITSGTVGTGRLGTGTADGTTFLRGDGAWTAPPVTSVATKTGAVTLDHQDVSNAVTTLSEFTADQDDLNLGSGGIIRISADDERSVTGFVATSGGDARLLVNVGDEPITLLHNDTDSDAGNRILCVGEDDYEIPPKGGSVVVWYDSTSSRWRAG